MTRLSRLLLLGSTLLLLPVHAQPQPAEPDSAPVLRLEMGGHTDTVNGFAVDADERWAVTVSDDQTARVWDLISGRLQTVLRPPSQPAIGKLYAVAISGDGARIAVAGITDSRWYGGNAVFVFNRQGRLLRTLEGIRGTIKRIAFSTGDGTLVVGAFGGIHVYDGQSLTEIGAFTDQSAREPEDLAVSRDGAIAYTVLGSKPVVHGVLILCGKETRNWTCNEVAATRDQNRWSTPAFSRDGSKLMAGERGYFANSKVPAGVHIWALPGLTPLPEPTVAGAEPGLTGESAWTAGDCVAAAMDGRVRIWASNGRSYRDMTTAGMAAALQPSGDCAAYVLTRGAEQTLYRFDGRSGDRVSLLGLRAEVAPMWLGRVDDWKAVAVPTQGQPISSLFRLEERSIAGTAPQVTYTATLYSAAAPAVLVKQIRSPGSFSAFTNVYGLEDLSALLISHSSALLRVNADGRVVWSVPAPNATKRLAISADHKVVVAFFPDGVVRWYRFENGKQILSFFQHPDQKRWVLWTPSGYYDAGPGGDGLIGWQLNQGRSHAADFFPISRFRETFYRPDVIDQVLETLDESLALANVNGTRRAPARSVAGALPPVVELVDSPQLTSKSTTLTVRVALRTSADAPVTALKARVNGHTVAVGSDRGISVETLRGDVRELKLTIPPEDCDILIFAESRNGVSTPAYLAVKWDGRAAVSDAVSKPKLYVLAIGVSDYENSAYRLQFAAKDARDFANAFAAQRNRLYRDVEVKLLTDRAAGRDAVADGLEWLQKQVTARDVGMLFLAGHGINAPDGNYYFAPANFDLNSIKRTGVVFSEIKDTLSAMAGKALFFVDTCHSGNVLGGRRALPDLNAMVNELSSAENGVVVFSSATGREAALEDAAWGNGAFTRALVEGVAGKADFNHTGRVTYRSLDFYISDRVKELTGGRQHSVTQAPGGVPDFPIASLLQ